MHINGDAIEWRTTSVKTRKMKMYSMCYIDVQYEN